MHTVELLSHAIHLAKRLGFEIRREWLGGSGGGDCELKGHKILVLDLALGPADQLEAVLGTLRRQGEAARLPMPRQLRELLTPTEKTGGLGIRDR